jgi:hypothetical protein
MKFKTLQPEIASSPTLGTVKQTRKNGRSRSPLAFSIQTCWILTLAALIAHAGLPAALAKELNWDPRGSDNLIFTQHNWDPDGRPSAGDSGVVAGAAQTGYSIGKAAILDGYTITYKDTSSLGVVNGPVTLILCDGTELKFQDNSVLQVGDHLRIGQIDVQERSGGATLTLAGNATAAIKGDLVFGTVGDRETKSGSGRLTLQGTSAVTVQGVMEWHQQYGGASETIHYLTLADSAKLTIQTPKSRSRNGATLVVNFQQADARYSPALTLNDDFWRDFGDKTISWQINGEETTLDDPRFDLDESAITLQVKP